MRQHALGPYPIDPNLLAQGIAPDSRVDHDKFIHGPIEGTPLPPAAVPPGEAPPPGAPPAEAPQEDSPVAEVPPAPDAPTMAPSAFSAGGSGGPSVAIATYDPRTGRYATPDGKVYRQLDLVPRSGDKTWEDLFTT